MPKTRLALMLALTALVAALIAGCGGSDDESSTTSSEASTSSTSDTGSGETVSLDDYATSVQEILAPLGTDLQALGTQIQGSKSPEDLASGVEQAQSTIDDGVSQLEGITPPEEIATEHEDLITALQDFNDSLGPVLSAAQSGDQQAIQEAAVEVPQAAIDFQTKIADITQRLQAAGVDLGGSTGTP